MKQSFNNRSTIVLKSLKNSLIPSTIVSQQLNNRLTIIKHLFNNRSQSFNNRKTIDKKLLKNRLSIDQQSFNNRSKID